MFIAALLEKICYNILSKNIQLIYIFCRNISHRNIYLEPYWHDNTRYCNIRIKRRVWGYQRDNHNPYIEEEQTTQWANKKNKRTNNDLQNIHIKLNIE